VVAAALEAGLLITSAGERVVRLLPPLTITAEEITEGCGLLRGVLAGAAG
jgi:4-aminobutyrate aminotransferase-like enzyme